jgi:hypothetical protein
MHGLKIFMGIVLLFCIATIAFTQSIEVKVAEIEGTVLYKTSPDASPQPLTRETTLTPSMVIRTGPHAHVIITVNGIPIPIGSNTLYPLVKLRDVHNFSQYAEIMRIRQTARGHVSNSPLLSQMGVRGSDFGTESPGVGSDFIVDLQDQDLQVEAALQSAQQYIDTMQYDLALESLEPFESYRGEHTFSLAQVLSGVLMNLGEYERALPFVRVCSNAENRSLDEYSRFRAHEIICLIQTDHFDEAQEAINSWMNTFSQEKPDLVPYVVQYQILLAELNDDIRLKRRTLRLLRHYFPKHEVTVSYDDETIRE